eukprot:3630271-Pyramimonas_sp.AAC.1
MAPGVSLQMARRGGSTSPLTLQPNFSLSRGPGKTWSGPAKIARKPPRTSFISANKRPPSPQYSRDNDAPLRIP